MGNQLEQPEPNPHRQCNSCLAVLPFTEFHKRTAKCKACRHVDSVVRHYCSSAEKRLFNSAKSRSVRKNREFALALSDVVIPPKCPVLGIPMSRPSIDRIDSARGYTPDNVRVISNRANMLKNNASVEELELVLSDLKRLRKGEAAC